MARLNVEFVPIGANITLRSMGTKSRAHNGAGNRSSVDGSAASLSDWKVEQTLIGRDRKQEIEPHRGRSTIRPSLL
jgi:hypothetical protein